MITLGSCPSSSYAVAMMSACCTEATAFTLTYLPFILSANVHASSGTVQPHTLQHSHTDQMVTLKASKIMSIIRTPIPLHIYRPSGSAQSTALAVQIVRCRGSSPL